MAENKPAASAQSTPPAEQPKAAGLRITFTPRSGSTKRGAQYLADAALVGLFGDRPIVMGGFTLALDKREVVIYMPGSQYRRDIRAKQIPLSAPITVDGETVTHADDPAGVKAMAALEQGIRDAWAAANATATPFTGEWPIGL